MDRKMYIYIQTDRWTNRQTEKYMDGKMYIYTYTDREMDRQADGQTDRQINRWKDRHDFIEKS